MFIFLQVYKIKIISKNQFTKHVVTLQYIVHIYSLISIRQNYNFDMLAMIWHKIVCWFLTNYQDLKRFATQEHRIVFILTFRCAKQFYVPNMQEQSKAGKKSEINRQTSVIWWLNSRTYRSVWYLFSCKHLYHSDLISISV